MKTDMGGIPNWVGWEGTQPMFGDNFPSVGQDTGATTGSAFDVILLPGELAEHPAPDGSYAVVRFTAPSSGSFVLNTVFEGREFLGTRPITNTDVHVLLDGVALYNGGIDGFGPSSDQSFAATLNLSAGDRVDFSVRYSSDLTFLGTQPA